MTTKDYTWTLTISTTVNFDEILYNFGRNNFGEKPVTPRDYQEAVGDYIAGLDDSEYYNLTDEVINQIEDDFVKYCHEKSEKEIDKILNS